MNEPNPKYPGEWRPMSKSISQPQPNRLTYAQAVFIEWFKSIHPKLHTHVYFTILGTMNYMRYSRKTMKQSINKPNKPRAEEIHAAA